MYTRKRSHGMERRERSELTVLFWFERKMKRERKKERKEKKRKGFFDINKV